MAAYILTMPDLLSTAVETTKVAPSNAYQLAASTIPKPGDPQWYFAFILLFFLVMAFIVVVLPKWRKGAEPAAAAPALPPAAGPAGSCECGARLHEVETRLQELEGLAPTIQLSVERAMQEALGHFREELTRNSERNRADIKAEMKDSERRVCAMFATQAKSFRDSTILQVRSLLVNRGTTNG